MGVKPAQPLYRAPTIEMGKLMEEASRRLRAARDQLLASGEEHDREAVFEQAFLTAVAELQSR